MQYGSLLVDGIFGDWTSLDRVERPGNTLSDYELFGKFVAEGASPAMYVLGFQSTAGTNLNIAANTTIWLNTDQNRTTGTSPFGSVGAEYFVNFFTDGLPYLYTAAGVLVGTTALDYASSADGKGFEIAIPATMLTAEGGTAPRSINFVADVNDATFLPGDYLSAQYTITDPSTIVPVDHAAKKVGIVWSETTANLYFSKTAYADLFLAAQHQAQMAGVSYDILTEADLTNVQKLAAYGALVFPSMSAVNSADLAAISASLSKVVYDYHVGIITAGDFLTNDQTGAAFAGNSYATMTSLLGLARTSGGTATFTVTPGDLTNPILQGYAAGELIGGAAGGVGGTTAGTYVAAGYGTYAAVDVTADVLANINIAGGGSVAGVQQTTTGGTNVHFATTALFGDSNLLSHAIQSLTLGTAPTLALHSTRQAGLFAGRNDMDISQYIEDVAPVDNNGNPLPGIYDKLVPILADLKATYNFVGSYYINIGDTPAGPSPTTTNWAVSKPYYLALLAMGNEIGTHSYTHLVNPPPGTPAENTAFLSTTGTGSFTFDYEFNQSARMIEQQLGIKIVGAAVPGAPEPFATSENILRYFPSSEGTTGYVSGGFTGVGSGYPSAFGYISPTDQGAVYLAPNITFDFTEIQFQNETTAQALADWKAQFDAISVHADVPIVVWPIHDYGVASWSLEPGVPSPYDLSLFTDFLAYAQSKNFEFVTVADLASRIVAQEKATLTVSTTGDVVTATVTPDPSAPNLGAFALEVTNGGTQLIKSVANWYAYDQKTVFLPSNGGTFAVTLGTTQDDVTHISSLPMRADLLTLSGNGSDLSFSILGDGVTVVDLKAPGTSIVSVQGAPAGTLIGDLLTLTFADVLTTSVLLPYGAPVQHNVIVTQSGAAIASAGADLQFGSSTDDLLFGGGGNDILDGGAGINTASYSGFQTDYLVTANIDGSVTLQDLRTGSPDGTDKVIRIQNFQFAGGVTLSLDQLVAGVTNGTAGNDTLTSTIAFRTINGLAGDDRLTAGAANQVLNGGDGADTLNDGGAAIAGITTLAGGAGNDIYNVAKASDLLIEQPNAGTDLIRTTLSSFLLGDNFENLTFTGTGAFTGTGNALANTITGGAGNDVLSGGLNTAGVDRLVGGLGDDTYVVDNLGNVVREQSNAGVDTVRASVSTFTLAANVENLQFTGAGNFSGIGNAAANLLVGGSGNDTLSGLDGRDRLVGGAGADLLTGGAGADTFIFAAGFGKDIITDFRVSDVNHDVLELSATMFAAGTTATSLLADPAIVSQAGANVVIAVTPNDTITLNNVLLATLKLNTADIHFV